MAALYRRSCSTRQSRSLSGGGQAYDGVSPNEAATSNRFPADTTHNVAQHTFGESRRWRPIPWHGKV
eukprot:5337335-Ditylum_brightwellii.AAC.1